MEYVLQTSVLCKKYQKFTALDNLTMHIPKGAIYGFIGKNGAGKTTLIRLLCGLQQPTSGELSLYGTLHTQPQIQNVRKRIGAVVETPSIYLDMTAEENLRQQFQILGLPSYREIPGLLQLVGLQDTGKKKAKHFSLGMRQRLGIAIALCGNPDFLILDEPVNGLDPQGIIEIRELILKLNHERQITFLISSHILDELAKLATHYGFIDHGHMLKELTADELNAICRKCITVTVTDTKALSRVLTEMGVEYKILSDTTADIYAEVHISRLALALDREHCELISVHEHDESLESYYVNLVGGDHHE